jgi:hypothetical protein
MAKLPNGTLHRGDDVFVCAEGRDGKRPCDGDLWRIANLPRT